MAVSTCGERISTERHRVKMTAVDLAKRAGISPQYLNDLERDRRQCPWKTGMRIADALGCELLAIDPMVMVPLSAVKTAWLERLMPR